MTAHLRDLFLEVFKVGWGVLVPTAANMWIQEAGKRQRKTDRQMDNVVNCLQPPTSGLSFPSCTGWEQEGLPLPYWF